MMEWWLRWSLWWWRRGCHGDEGGGDGAVVVMMGGVGAVVGVAAEWRGRVGCGGAGGEVIERQQRGDDGGGVMVGCGGEAAGGGGGAWRRVTMGDRVDRVTRNIFRVGRKSPPENFSGDGGEVVVAGIRRLAGGKGGRKYFGRERDI
ncbi:hypothetical protein Tco_0254047 [Tanacetum coccineum]